MGQSFRDFMEGRLEAAPGEFPTQKDWEAHLASVYPEVLSAVPRTSKAPVACTILCQPLSEQNRFWQLIYVEPMKTPSSA